MAVGGLCRRRRVEIALGPRAPEGQPPKKRPAARACGGPVQQGGAGRTTAPAPSYLGSADSRTIRQGEAVRECAFRASPRSMGPRVSAKSADLVGVRDDDYCSRGTRRLRVPWRSRKRTTMADPEHRPRRTSRPHRRDRRGACRQQCRRRLGPRRTDPVGFDTCFDTLGRCAADEPAVSVELTPAVPIRRSVTDDHIVCLEDGKKLKMLKRHLMTDHGLTPEAYRSEMGTQARLSDGGAHLLAAAPGARQDRSASAASQCSPPPEPEPKPKRRRKTAG